MESSNCNKTVRCETCGKYMRSDHRMRHEQTHKTIVGMINDDASNKLKNQHDEGAEVDTVVHCDDEM